MTGMMVGLQLRLFSSSLQYTKRIQYVTGCAIVTKYLISTNIGLANELYRCNVFFPDKFMAIQLSIAVVATSVSSPEPRPSAKLMACTSAALFGSRTQ